ncbi:hypothetical protein Q0M94_28570 (plasmid) [Deinococcus radiomollis]|uniref:hypothetical protein n=1 Tax=Deinococcus radiomollis TaxID=468916 RepID=UPI0038929B7D
MTRKLWFIPLLALASCAPSLTGPKTAPATTICGGSAGKVAALVSRFDGEKGTLSCEGASIVLSNPGPGPMKETVIRVEGPGLILGAPCVARADTGVWGCIVGTVPEGQKYRLTPTAGTISKASANFYKGNNVLFTRVELP